jgi:long-chain fatty acid transport protein
MSMHSRLVGSLVVIGCLATASANADGFRNPPPTANGLGAIGARYTLIDDASSMSYNPANMAGLEEREAIFAATFVKSEKEYKAPTGEKADVNDDWLVLPDLFLALPYKQQKLVAGIGVTTPYGQSTEYEKTSVFRYTAPYFAEMRAININPTVAFQLNDKVSLAVGADILWSDLDLRQIYPWVTVTGDPTSPDGDARYEADGVGFGGNIGLLVKLTDKQELGVTYRSAIDVDYEGDFKISSFPAALPPPIAAFATPKSDFETSIKFPHTVGLGYGVQVSDRLAVGVDVEWFKWSDYEELPLDIDNNTALQPSASIPQDWEDTWTYGLGAEYSVNEAWTARAGYIFLETPVPDATMLPALPENDQHVFTVGAGYHRGAHQFDFAYALGLYDDREINDSFNPAYNGTYEFQSHLVGLTYGLTF